MKLSVTTSQITEVQHRIAAIQDEVADLIKQTKRLQYNVDLLMNEMKELKLMLSNLGNLMALPPAHPKDGT